MGKLWGGRFGGVTNEKMERFNASISFDRRLYRADVAGSLAYAECLKEAGILSAGELDSIAAGLRQVEGEIERGELSLPDTLEDIHTAVEARLTEIAGEPGSKLHTGRSRNEQVALDERIYLKEALDDITRAVVELQATLLGVSDRNLDVVMPGYTHMQQAQPILLSHYMMALFWMLERDKGRIADCGRRSDVMPLGSGAIAGSGFPIPRDLLAKRLGFSSISENSIDAVSDRDFLLEALSAIAILMTHLSRYCEDLVVWSSAEFSFIELDDAFSTGSSMMPQKKNPDSLELVRGKTGRVTGDLVALLVAMKGVPLTYSKDLQEDKEPLFDAVDSAVISLHVFRGVLETLRVNSDRMRQAIGAAASATDLADYLVLKGIPFREAHRMVGGLFQDRATFKIITLDDLRRVSPAFEEDALCLLDPAAGIERRSVPGGTSRASVEAQIKAGRGLLRSGAAGTC